MGDKPIFLRPVEIVTGTNDTIKVKVSGAGSFQSATLTAGVYPSMFAVIWEFTRAIAGAGGSVSLSSASNIDGGDVDGKYIYWSITFSGTHVMLIDQEATGRMLGWGRSTSTQVSGTTINFNHQPEYCWIPRFQVANQGRFYRKLDQEVSGKITKTGAFAGNSTGPTLNYRDLQFNNEKAFNVLEEGADGELYSNRSDITKNLQYFVNQSMTVSPSVAGNVSPRGFWYVPDWNEVIGTVSNSTQGPSTRTSSPDRTTEIGIRFDLTTSADKWAFCQFEEAAVEPPVDVGVPTGRELYNQANMIIHTADYPSFYNTFEEE
jgi:hypothetical protein